MRLLSPAISATPSQNRRVPQLPRRGVVLFKAAWLGVVLLTLAGSACKTENVLPPSPTSLINGTRDRLNPYRLNLTTDPDPPNVNSHNVLKVHVIDAAGQPADGVEVQADVSFSSTLKHVTLSGLGGGDYSGEVDMDTAGPWDVDLTASKDGKSSKRRILTLADREGPMKTVMLYEVAPFGLPKAMANLEAHRVRLNEFHARGVLLMAGPLGNPPEGAMGVFSTREAAEEFVQGDPFVVNRVVSKRRLVEWAEVFS